MVFVECKSPMERTAHPDRTRSMVESTSFVVKKKKRVISFLSVTVVRTCIVRRRIGGLNPKGRSKPSSSRRVENPSLIFKYGVSPSLCSTSSLFLLSSFFFPQSLLFPRQPLFLTLLITLSKNDVPGVPQQCHRRHPHRSILQVTKKAYHQCILASPLCPRTHNPPNFYTAASCICTHTAQQDPTTKAAGHEIQ